ncbi:salicylate hydroxylase [Annulohypoxylon maeteangense]|uniref:salicylate hydroxylase n=1 Tax=Annulohypoxylon maeteangense TaxID=1927788 RepID=UPI0020073988|nr:salicylate hydroxylase [Annulohypoxylon maeteangense]KAI0890387.1 salicylate hydroxylase [Annulohypoxylon maeteangense]
MANKPPDRIRVGIVGGGLAGATLANALIVHSHLDIELFEASHEFSERGAAVGLSVNAQNALRQIIPSIREFLAKAGAVDMNSTRTALGSGPAAGTIIYDIAASSGLGVVLHRASLLRELLHLLPKEILHANKKLKSINPNRDGRVELGFEDGTIECFDAVIGADGIFSIVRHHVLQDAAEECAPSPAGYWDSRNLVPFEKAKKVLGEKYFETDRQWSWVGDGAFLLHNVLENGAMVQVIISAIEPEPPKDRKRPLTKEFLDQTLDRWFDGPIAKGMIELMLDQDNPQGYSQWEHRSTKTYANGYVCVVGDAAHATTPWQGAGAGLAIEDAMVLGTLFSKVTSSRDVPAAFKAYDEIRRPRCQRVIDSSREMAGVYCGRNPGAGLDPDKLREIFASRYSFILGLDMEAHKAEAMHAFVNSG